MIINFEILRCLSILRERILRFESLGKHSTNSDIYRAWRLAENSLRRFEIDWVDYHLYYRYLYLYWNRRIDHHFGVLHELRKI